MIEHAYRQAEKDGLTLWCQDEAGPYQAIPQPTERWAKEGHPHRHPHTYVRGGTAKLLSLFHPLTGEIRVKGVTQSTNAILHPWIKEQVGAILASLPEADPSELLSESANRARWERYQEGLSVKFSLLSSGLPSLRMLLIWDNLAGHWNADLLIWLMQQGVMMLFTPISGSWLNLCESAQRIVVRRALQGQSFETPDSLISALESAAVGWNASPTPFEWGGKRALRRERARARRINHRLGGSGGFTRRPIRRRWDGNYACLQDK